MTTYTEYHATQLEIEWTIDTSVSQPKKYEWEIIDSNQWWSILSLYLSVITRIFFYFFHQFRLKRKKAFF